MSYKGYLVEENNGVFTSEGLNPKYPSNGRQTPADNARDNFCIKDQTE